jgi:hypothetical protein
MNATRRRLARTLGLALILSLLVGAVACGGDDKKDTTPTAGSGSGQATPPPRPDPKTLVNEAADKLEQAKSFHFVLEHEKGSTPIVLMMQMTRAEGDVVRPDRLRADVDAQFAGQKLKVRLVSIGDSAKITSPLNPNRFQDLPAGTRVSDIFDPAAGGSAALRNAKDPQITGDETLDGKKVWKVQGDVDAGTLTALTALAEPGNIVKGTAWITQDTHEVYRIRLEGPLGAEDTREVIRVLTITRYNENIEITPVP